MLDIIIDARFVNGVHRSEQNKVSSHGPGRVIGELQAHA